MGDPLFKLRNVTKVFGKTAVLSNVTIDVMPGEVLSIIGASGSGKTTLLSTLIGFYTPDKGEVLCRIRKKTGTIFQSVERMQIKRIYGFASQLPSFYRKLTVSENMAYFGSLYHLSSAAIKKNTQALLNLMDLPPDVLAENLSGGMERRLDIACAMIHHPDVLILDEPTADLDPSLREHVNAIIQIINKQGTTVVIASHHLHDMERISTRVVLLTKGRVLDAGTPVELIRKHVKDKTIILETYPGDYKKILSRITIPYELHTKGTRITLSTKNLQGLLTELMPILAEEKESILTLHVIEPTLEDVFLELQ